MMLKINSPHQWELRTASSLIYKQIMINLLYVQLWTPLDIVRLVSFSFMALLTGLGFLFQAQVAVPFTDQYFNTVLSAYGPQAVVSNLTVCGSRIIRHIAYQFETNPYDKSDSIQ